MLRTLALLLCLCLSVAVLAEGPSSAVRKTKRNVEIEFEAIEGASLYEIKIIATQGSKKPRLFKLNEPKWSANIKPGMYSMQLRAYDERGVPGEWSPATELKVKVQAVDRLTPEPAAQLSASETSEHEVHFKWQPVASALKYKFIVQSKDSNFKFERELAETEISIKLPVAENFEWNVTAVDAKGEDGDNDKPEEFQLLGGRLEAPIVVRPLSRYVERLEWSAPDHADRYTTVLEYRDPKSGIWSQVERKDASENSLAFNYARPSGRYRLDVLAHGKMRADSKVGRREFDVLGGFTDEDALKRAQRRDGITHSGNNYFIAGLSPGQLTYGAKNYDANSAAEVSTMSTALRLGYGRRPQDSNYGEYLLLDVANMNVSGASSTFSSLEAHATRKFEFGQVGLFQVDGGLFYKEVPIVNGTPYGAFTALGKATEIGPHVGASYWHPFSQRWGAKANLQIYDGFFGSATTGGKLENSISYQYSVMGSYRLGTNWIGYFGLAFLHDEARYASSPSATNFSTAGETNTVTIDGKALNLIIEYSF